MAQAVSRRSLTAEARVHPSPVSCRVDSGQGVTGTVLYRVLQSSSVGIIPPFAL